MVSLYTLAGCALFWAAMDPLLADALSEIGAKKLYRIGQPNRLVVLKISLSFFSDSTDYT